MKPVHRRGIVTTLVVLAVYVAVCVALVAALWDPAPDIGFFTALGRLSTSLGMLVPLFFVWVVSIQLSLRKYYPKNIAAEGGSSSSDVEWTKLGVNGMPLDGCGFDPTGNFNGIDTSCKIGDD